MLPKCVRRLPWPCPAWCINRCCGNRRRRSRTESKKKGAATTAVDKVEELMNVTPALLFAAAELPGEEPTMPAAAAAQLKTTQPNRVQLKAAQMTTTDSAIATGTASTPPDDHLEHLREIIQAAAKKPTGRRDATAQEPQRRLQDHIRQRAVDFYEQSTAAGGTLQEAAERLWVCPR